METDFWSLGIETFFVRGLFCWFSRRAGRPSRVAVREIISSVRSFSATKLHRRIGSVMPIKSQQNEVLSCDVDDEEAAGSRSLELAS